MIIVGTGVFEFYAKVWYGDEKYESLIQMVLTIVPDNYTIGEALKVFRKLMPLVLQLVLLSLDNSFDKVSEQPEE